MPDDKKNTQMDEIKEAARLREEANRRRADEELAARMRSGDIQLRLFDDEKIPFYSQDVIERKSVFLPNTARQKSFELLRNESLKITIGKAGGDKEYGILKIKHKDVLYAVLAIWASNGWPCWEGKVGVMYGHIRTTRYKILHLILQKNPGKNDYKSLMDTLQDLKTIPVEVYDLESDDPKEVFSIFHGYDYKAEADTEQITIHLNPYITKQYYKKDNDLKLLFFDTYRNLSSDISKTLYPILDRMLGTRDSFNKRVADLCAETGLTFYKKNSKIKGVWQKALDELNTVKLTNGKKLSIELYENKLRELILLAKTH